MASDIPDEVRRFIAAHIDSVSLLDVLLLLRAAPDKDWTPAETGRALVTSESVAETHLRQLERQGLVKAGEGGFRYTPGGEAASIEGLADCYAKRRHKVIALVYGSDVRQATTLADAFTLRRKKR